MVVTKVLLFSSKQKNCVTVDLFHSCLRLWCNIQRAVQNIAAVLGTFVGALLKLVPVLSAYVLRLWSAL